MSHLDIKTRLEKQGVLGAASCQAVDSVMFQGEGPSELGELVGSQRNCAAFILSATQVLRSAEGPITSVLSLNLQSPCLTQGNSRTPYNGLLGLTQLEPTISLTSILTTLFLTLCALATPASRLALKHDKHAPASGPLCMLFPLPDVSFPHFLQTSAQMSPSQRGLLWPPSINSNLPPVSLSAVSCQIFLQITYQT